MTAILQSGRFGVPAVTYPTDISGCTCVLDADVGTYEAISGLDAAEDNDLLERWRDVVSSRDFDQVTSTKRPTLQTNELNGHSIVRFDGGDVLASAAANWNALFAAGAGSVVAVMKQLGTDDENTLFTWTASGERVLVHATYVNTFYWDYPTFTTGRISVAQPGGWDDAWHIVMFTKSTTTAKIIVDGSELVSASNSGTLTTASTSGFVVGAIDTTPSVPFSGDLAMLATYNKELSSTERTDLRSALQSRFGL